MVHSNLATSRNAGIAGFQPARIHSVHIKYKERFLDGDCKGFEIVTLAEPFNWVSNLQKSTPS